MKKIAKEMGTSRLTNGRISKWNFNYKYYLIKRQTLDHHATGRPTYTTFSKADCNHIDKACSRFWARLEKAVAADGGHIELFLYLIYIPICV